MIQKNRRLLHVTNAAIDFVIALVTYIFSERVFPLVYMRIQGSQRVLFLGTQGPLFWPILTSLLMVLLMAMFGMYNSLRTRRIRKEFWIILQTSAIVVLVISALFLLVTEQGLSRGMLLFFFGIVSVLLGIKRWIMHAVLGYIRRTGNNLKHVLVLGSGPLAKQYAAGLDKNRFFGFTIDGYLGDSPDAGYAEYLGTFDKCETLLETLFVDEIVIALEPENACRLNDLIHICEASGIKTSVVPSFSNIIPSNPAIEIIGDTKLVLLRCNRLENFGYAALKRTCDILISALLLIVLSPVLLLVALGVKLTSPGPVLFKQKRLGKDRREFLLLKFRSMRVNDSEETGWTTDADERKTAFGTFLRKFSLDEIPQFWNVIRGDMSVVGPRPEIAHFVNIFRKTVPQYMVKHQIRPGITGLAQVNGYRGDTDIEERIRYDIWYIENWTIWLDIKIIFRTAFGGWINHEKLTRKKERVEP